MNTNFKTALNQIHADPLLIDKTEQAMNEIISGASKGMQKRLPLRIVVAFICLALIITGSSFGAFMYYKTPICYLSLDINPSIELGINAFGSVVSSKAFNEEGTLILDGIITSGQNVQMAVKALIISAIEKGYIAGDGSTVILLTAEVKGDSQALVNRIEKNSEMGLELALKEKEKTAILKQESISLNYREQAQVYGISPGKLNLINKLQMLNADTVIDNYLNSSIKEIMVQINESSENKNQTDSKGNGGTQEIQENTLPGEEPNTESNTEQNTERNTEQNTETKSNGKSMDWNKSNTPVETTEESSEEVTTGEEVTTKENATTKEIATTNENGEGTMKPETTEPSSGPKETNHGTTEENGQENTSETPNTTGKPDTSGTTGGENGDGRNH